MSTNGSKCKPYPNDVVPVAANDLNNDSDALFALDCILQLDSRIQDFKREIQSMQLQKRAYDHRLLKFILDNNLEAAVVTINYRKLFQIVDR